MNMTTHKDPVCGMQIEETQAVGKSDYLEQAYYFCSEVCQTKFDEEPEKYINQKEKS